MDQPSRAPLTIEVSFETTRLSVQCLIEAYDRPRAHPAPAPAPAPREPEPGDSEALTMRRSEPA